MRKKERKVAAVSLACALTLAVSAPVLAQDTFTGNDLVGAQNGGTAANDGSAATTTTTTTDTQVGVSDSGNANNFSTNTDNTANTTTSGNNTGTQVDVQDSGNGNDLSTNNTPILAQGCNTLVLVATDLAGNWSSDKRSINFDDQKPTLAVTDPGADLRTSISIMSVKGTVADTLSAVTVKVISDSATFTPAVENGSFYQEVRFTQNAVYHILVKAIDAGGNETSVQRNIV